MLLQLTEKNLFWSGDGFSDGVAMAFQMEVQINV